MTSSVPTPEEQVLFLRNIQRLLAEGQFVASYKFALLHALADLAVDEGRRFRGTPRSLKSGTLPRNLSNCIGISAGRLRSAAKRPA